MGLGYSVAKRARDRRLRASASFTSPAICSSFGSLVFALGMLVHDFAQSEEPGAAHRSCIALAFKQGYESRAAAVPFLEECMGTIGAGWEFAADQTLHPACDLGADSHYDSRCWLPMQRAQQAPSAAPSTAGCFVELTDDPGPVTTSSSHRP